MKLYNDKNDHFLCHYTLVIDSFSKFCDIGCVYCYAKDFGPEQRTSLSLPKLRALFEEAFDKEANSGISKILRRRIPVRLGFETDPFQDLEKKTQITYEMLKLFKKYRYPYIIFTKSPLCLEKKYLELFEPELTYIQVSVSSPRPKMGERLEPLAASAQERVKIVQQLQEKGIDSALRFNLLPQILHQLEDGQYYQACVDFIKGAQVKKVILNRITLQNERGSLQFPYEPEQFFTLKEELAEQSKLTLCYLGSPAIDFFNYESKDCDNCCQCDLSPGNKTTALPLYLTDEESYKKRVSHILRMGMLKTLSFTLRNGAA